MKPSPAGGALTGLMVGLALWISSPSEVTPAEAPKFRRLIETHGQKPPPNVVLILADELGYGDLACYGQKGVRTPNLDRLAAEGTRYTQFYAGSPSSAATRCSLLTGKHSGHADVRGDEPFPLSEREPSLAKLLTALQYQTMFLGTWGLGLAGTSGEPLQQGFQEARCLLDLRQAGNYHPTLLYRDGSEWRLENHSAVLRSSYLPDLMMLMATNYLRSAQYRPFFFVYSANLPRAEASPAASGPSTSRTDPEGAYRDRPWAPAEKRKAALISRLDQDVGALLAHLHIHRMESNTFVFFTSACGPPRPPETQTESLRSSGPLRGAKGDLHEGGIRMPMIAWAPGKVPAGRVSDQVWAAWDFLPTVIELTGAPKLKGIDGISMARSLYGLTQTNQHAFLYWESHAPHSQQALRQGSWKGVRLALEQPLALYNLEADPQESKDVSSQHPELVQKMEEILKKARTDHPRWPLKPIEPASAPRAGAQ